jgi:hypothetical protein
MRRFLLLLVGLSISPHASTAQETKLSLSRLEAAALSSVHGATAECAAYYGYVAACQKVQDSRSAAINENISTRLRQRGMNIAALMGMPEEKARAQESSSDQSMLKLSRNSCSNTSALHDRFAARCKRLADEPNSVYQEYLKNAR